MFRPTREGVGFPPFFSEVGKGIGFSGTRVWIWVSFDHFSAEKTGLDV